MLFWTLTSTDVFFAVRAERKSGYLAVAFGRFVTHNLFTLIFLDSFFGLICIRSVILMTVTYKWFNQNIMLYKFLQPLDVDKRMKF